MVLRLQYLKYQTSGNQLIPYFLSLPRDEVIPQKLINHLESYVGQQRGDVDFETPLTWVPDTRLARALQATAFARFYSFKLQQLDALLTPEELSSMQLQGIANLESFRLWFWRFVEEHHNGFIPRSNRNDIFSQVAQALSLKSESVERLLVAHRDKYMLMERKNSQPSPEEFIGAYNFEVIETLLYNSESITFTITGKSLGSAARILLKITKRYGVLVDLESEEGLLRVIISGPRVYFGRASAFGWNIAQVISRLLQESSKLAIQVVDFNIDVILRDRHYVVQLHSQSIPTLNPRVEPRYEEAFLDSKVEKQFYWSWYYNKFRGWDIIREPDAILCGSRLIVPDFALVKDDQKVLVEIIGYWREEYTEKKKQQFRLLKQCGLKDFILLVDNKHRQHFSKAVYPAFFYRSRGKRYEIPYGKILKALPNQSETNP